jgi:hypothetical protein
LQNVILRNVNSSRLDISRNDFGVIVHEVLQKGLALIPFVISTAEPQAFERKR